MRQNIDNSKCVRNEFEKKEKAFEMNWNGIYKKTNTSK